MTSVSLHARGPLRFTGDAPFARMPLYVALLISFYVVVDAYLFSRAIRDDSALPYVLIGLFTVVPALLYCLVRAPLATSFSAYVLFMPFDSLSRVGSFGTFTKILGILCAAVILVRLFSRMDALRAPRVLVAWLGLLLWMTVSAFWAQGTDDAAVALYQYAALIALFAVLSVTPVRRGDFIAIVASIVVAGVVAAGYDVYLFHFGQSVMAGEQRVMVIVGESRIDPNEYAAALMLPIALALHFLFDNRSRGVRMAMLPALLILFGGLASSGSRGGIISVAAVFAYFIYKSKHRFKFAGALAACAAVGLSFNPGLILRFQHAGVGDGAGRGDIWRVGLQAFREHWLAGWGVGNFTDAYDATHLHVFTRYIQGWSWHAHNTVLMVATELGIVGLTLWAVAVCSQFNVVRAIEKTSPLFEMRITLQAAFIGVFVAGLATSNLNAKYAWLSYSMILLLRGYTLTRERAQRAQPIEQTPTATPIHLKAA